MSKPIIEVTDPVYIGNVMYCTLAQDDLARGWAKGKEIRTSRIIAHHPEHNSVETLNTIYVVVTAEEPTGE